MAFSRAQYSSEMNFFGPFSPMELAQKFGTPLYVYNESILRARCRDLINMLKGGTFQVSYSIKANSNPALLKIVREEGLWADAMSPGELFMDQLAGYRTDEILYISNNITMEEMKNAIANGCLVSVDSLSQLDMLGKLNPGGRVMARINPGLGAGHHAKVVTAGAKTKFGIAPTNLPEILDLLHTHGLKLAGLNQHIGSLFMEPQKYADAAAFLLDFAESLPAGHFQTLEILDFGGGFGIPYHKYDHEPRLDLPAMGSRLLDLTRAWSEKTGYGGKFLVEPGRYVVAECGLLLGRVTSVKSNGEINFVGTDLGFNVLQRPVMYDSFHDIEVYDQSPRESVLQTIVGNICESGDILAKDRMLPRMEPGDLIGVLDAGAYGFSMASSYNDRFLPAEVLIEAAGGAKLIRRRQTTADLAACLCNL